MAMIPLPYGIDLFEQVRKDHCYYVDKTHLISEMMSVPFKVNLITRPRRFGKTLAMSMLASFFDIRKDSGEFFEGLEISKNRELCAQWMNQWPVLFVTLKDVSGQDFQDAYGMLRQLISKLCKEHSYLKTSDRVDAEDKVVFNKLYVLLHVLALSQDKKAKPGNHWLDTSHNNIIRRFIDLPDIFVNDKFEILLAGGVIQERIREDLTYDIAHSSEDNLWSILYLTGYLTQVLPEELPGEMTPQEGKTSLRIPNEEVKSVFKDTVQSWFEASVKAGDRSGLFNEWWNGEDEKLTEDVSDILFNTISYYDYKEDFYHAFVAGMFSGAGYEVKSNSEQGKGRADIVIKERRRRRAIVIEAK